jgi:putative tricarboxylic transport membrane protein
MQDDPGAPLSARWPEVAVALLMAALGVLVIVDSLRVGIGWADDGPRSGYFPFYVGLLLLGASLITLVQQLRRWRADSTVFAGRAQLRSVLAVLLPLVVYVAAIRWLGLYVASALLIGAFMLRHGAHRRAVVAAVALGVPTLLFLVFERWFLLPLPKGPLEQLLLGL